MPASTLLIGLGAGAASALLYRAAASGSPFALLLLYIAPLPILLAAAGWRHHAGLVATLFATVALGLALSSKTGVYFAASVGLPAWWLGYLALLARPDPRTGAPEWYPVGRLVIWCAVLGALLVSLSIPLIATSLEDYRAVLKATFEKALSSPDGRPPQLPGGEDASKLIDVMAVIAPGMAASFWTAASIFNLWLAGRITRASGRLARPWPEIQQMTFPLRAPLGLLGGVAGSFLPGLAGLVAELFAGVFLIAFAILGLTVLHVTTRANPARGLVLFGVYSLLVLLPWVVVFVASLGLAEHFFQIRRRFGPPPPPPTARATLP